MKTIQKIVITGATSMVGAALARCAIDANIEVLCIVRKNSDRLNNLPQSNLVKIEYCDIDQYCNLSLDIQYEIFYHLARDKASSVYYDDVDIQTANIQYTLDAVRLAKRLGCKKFIGAGSQAEYGTVTEPLKPETPVNPQSGYGIAKYAAGKLSRLLCSQLDMEFNWVRILSVYGPLDGIQTLIMYTIHELQKGRSPEFTRCEQIWDYLYCDDAARALLAIGKNGVTGKTYPLGSGSKRKLSEYLESLRDIVAPGAVLQYGKKEYYPHQPMYLCADISELTNDTGWKPEVSFEEGIKKIITSLAK
jgi:nucleoside-diphosphate-sugar epimerase